MKMSVWIIAALMLFALFFYKHFKSRLSHADMGDIRGALAVGAKLVDVRTVMEYREGHVAGALNIPLGELSRRLKELGPRSTTIVLYCRSGSRAASAMSILQGKGYKKVLNMKTMQNWQVIQQQS